MSLVCLVDFVNLPPSDQRACSKANLLTFGNNKQSPPKSKYFFNIGFLLFLLWINANIAN